MGCGASTTKNPDERWAAGACCGGDGAYGVVREFDEDDDSGVVPYSPSSSLCEWYNRQLAEGCRRYNAPIDEPARVQKRRGLDRPQSGEKESSRSEGLTGGTSELTAVAARESEKLTVYHMKSLGRRIGRGMFSDVTLADMTVCEVPKDAWIAAKRDGEHPECNGDHITKYLIACKEYSTEGVCWSVLDELVKEAEHLSRLKFNNRLLKVFLVERVQNKADSAQIQTTASYPETALRVSAIRMDPFNLCRNTAVDNERPRSTSKLRLYMEYAKYGTLRDMLVKEIPDRFGKTYMHELTVRAYMRDVLLALTILHEAGVVHGDLCAKNIFISNPITRVYGTSYPAYISDIPAGPLDRASPRAVARALISNATDNSHFLVGTEASPSRAEGSTGGPHEVHSAVGKAGRWYSMLGTPTGPQMTAGGLKMEPLGLQRIGSVQRRSEPTSVIANLARTECNDCESDCSHWVDDDVKHLVQEYSYIDGEVVSIPSANSSVNDLNIGTNGLLAVAKVVRDASLGSTGAIPNALSFAECTNVAENSTAAHAKCGEELEARGMLGSGGHPPSAPYGGQQRLGNGSINSSACTYHRNSKVLVKLGHYGRIRSILLSEMRDASHLLGSVPHLAPECMETGVLTPAGDIYAFAMTFIELTTPHGGLYEDQHPSGGKQSERLSAEAEVNRVWMDNIKRFIEDNFRDIPFRSSCPRTVGQCCDAVSRVFPQTVPRQWNCCGIITFFLATG